MLRNDPDRMAMVSGGPEPISNLDKRINAIIGDEVKFAKEYGRPYFDSGVGLFGRLERSLGDSGQGRRAFDAIQKVNRQMKGEYTAKQLADMLNKGYENEKLPFRFELPKELMEMEQRDSKAEGGLLKNPEKADLDKDGTISDYEQARGEAIEESMEEREEMQEGGMMTEEMPQEMDEQMEMLMEEQQVPDEEMEEDYLDFIINEALNPEEEDFLMEQLESNPQLSEVFDKVIEVASEFSGAGPVEGPGTEVSDSIPARLSDGEFVFTAKATEELGVDNLMSMMKDAEARADERLPAQEGGVVEEEEAVAPREPVQVQQDIRVTKETVGSQAAMQEEEDLVGDEIKKGMMSTRPYVRS